MFALGNQDDLLLVVRRVEALGASSTPRTGRTCSPASSAPRTSCATRRRRPDAAYDGEVDPHLLTEPEEKALFEAIGSATGEAEAAVEVEDFDRAMSALAKLRAPVDAFFEKVLVNAPEEDVRANRLRLLNRIRQATRAVADFSKVGG